MLICGDSAQVLKQYEDNILDLIVTDPPYGIGFMGKDWDKALPDIEIWKQCYRVLKEGKLAFIMCSPRQDVLSRMIIGLEDAGFRTGYTSIYWTYASGFPKAANISKLIDKRNGAEREIISKRRVQRNSNSWECNNGMLGVGEQNFDITKPATEEAKKMEGAYVGFQPKPAVEVILVVSKGKTLTWLDDCRIPFNKETDTQPRIREDKRLTTTRNSDRTLYGLYGNLINANYFNQKGRFPANLLVSDDILNVFEKDYSRYFSLDQWWQKFIITPKASKSERNEGCEDLEPKPLDNFVAVHERNDHKPSMHNNSHPTVKPIKLMTYLITLGSRENDLVLDPFVGSGTTYKACLQTHRRCIGIEINKEYLEIAKARITPLLEQTKLVT